MIIATERGSPREGERAMAYEFIIAERHDGVALITLNRPDKLNALSFGLMSEGGDALTEYESDDAIKAVILTGAGERAFSAGAHPPPTAAASSPGRGRGAAPAGARTR